MRKSKTIKISILLICLTSILFSNKTYSTIPQQNDLPIEMNESYKTVQEVGLNYRDRFEKDYRDRVKQITVEAERKWPNNYRMQIETIHEQTEALKALLVLKNSIRAFDQENYKADK